MADLHYDMLPNNSAIFDVLRTPPVLIPHVDRLGSENQIFIPIRQPPWEVLQAHLCHGWQWSSELQCFTPLTFPPVADYRPMLMDHQNANIEDECEVVEQKHIICTWTRPLSGWLKVNTDGAASKMHTGTGGVFRNCNGECVGGFARPIPPTNSFNTEVLAIKHAVEMIPNPTNVCLWIESDSTCAIDFVVNDHESHDGALAEDLQFIRQRLQTFADWKISHIYREANEAADFLSRVRYNIQWFGTTPTLDDPRFESILEKDKTGFEYVRLKY